MYSAATVHGELRGALRPKAGSRSNGAERGQCRRWLAQIAETSGTGYAIILQEHIAIPAQELYIPYE